MTGTDIRIAGDWYTYIGLLKSFIVIFHLVYQCGTAVISLVTTSGEKR